MEKVICVFGDSVLWGWGLPFRVGWVNLFRNYIEDKSNYAMNLYDLGIDAETTDGVLERFDAEAVARKPDMIIFAIGINDSTYRKTKDYPITTVVAFEKNIYSLIKKARKFTKEIVFVGLCLGDERLMMPLPASKTGKCFTRENLIIYNDIIRKCCFNENVLFIDVIDKVKDGDFCEGLHPSISGHKKIFQEVKKKINLWKEDIHSKIIIVDKKDKVIGLKDRENLKNEDIYRVSGLWIENSKGEVLLARRAPSKSRDPNKWGPAVAGTLEEGETYDSNIIKETEEEIGLKNVKFKKESKSKIKLVGRLRYFLQWYTIKIDQPLEKFKIQESEVAEIRWFSKEEIRKKLKENHDEFINSVKQWIGLFL
ncbi:MAG: NUDIX domain-containing protein [Candidatus Pacebacteria bacterium]|nr:NUDIX domain-containing protein [Candidatus Paceibacterota bacterium]